MFCKRLFLHFVMAGGLALVSAGAADATEYYMIITQTKGDVDENGAPVWRAGPSWDNSLDVKGLKSTKQVVEEARKKMDESGDYVYVQILSDTRPIEWKGGPPPTSALRQDARGPQRQGAKSDKDLDAALESVLKEQKERADRLNDSLKLKEQKGALDEGKRKLDAERAALVEAAKRVRALEDKLGKLRQQLADGPLAGRSAAGWLGVRSNRFVFQFEKKGVLTGGTSTQDSKAYTGSYSLSGNRISMTLGPSTFEGTIEGSRLSGNRSRDDGHRDSWEATVVGGVADMTALRRELDGAERELNRGKADLESRRKKYKDSEAEYESSRAPYEQRVQRHTEDLKSVRDKAYNPPN